MNYESLEKLSYKSPDDYEKIYSFRFQNPYTVHVDFSIHHFPAFYEQIPEVSDVIIQIYKIRSDIAFLRNHLPDIALDQFARRCLIDEIVLTNDIEGVASTRKDISDVLESLQQRDRKKRFRGLVQKYVMLQEKAAIQLATCQDVRDIYNELVLNEISDADKGDIPDGTVFRREAVYVRSGTQKIIHQGLYPESAIQKAMEQALCFLNNESIEPLIRISIFHYLLGYIHPFYDGNGRLSRFISSYLLSKDIDPLLGYRLSFTIRENITDYYAAFKTCNNPRSRGELTPFLLFFLRIIETATNQLFHALKKRSGDLSSYSKLLDSLPFVQIDSEISRLGYLLVQAELFSEYGISIHDLLEVLKISRATLSKRLSVFESNGLLITQKMGKEKYYKIDLSILSQLARPKSGDS